MDEVKGAEHTMAIQSIFADESRGYEEERVSGKVHDWEVADNCVTPRDGFITPFDLPASPVTPYQLICDNNMGNPIISSSHSQSRRHLGAVEAAIGLADPWSTAKNAVSGQSKLNTTRDRVRGVTEKGTQGPGPVGEKVAKRTRGKNKNTKTLTLEEEEAKHRGFLERNRLAAKKSRTKKKGHVENLLARYSALITERRVQLAEILELRNMAMNDLKILRSTSTIIPEIQHLYQDFIQHCEAGERMNMDSPEMMAESLSEARDENMEEEKKAKIEKKKAERQERPESAENLTESRQTKQNYDAPKSFERDYRSPARGRSSLSFISSASVQPSRSSSLTSPQLSHISKQEGNSAKKYLSDMSANPNEYLDMPMPMGHQCPQYSNHHGPISSQYMEKKPQYSSQYGPVSSQSMEINYQRSQYSKQYGPISSQSMSMGHQSPQYSNQHGPISSQYMKTNTQYSSQYGPVSSQSIEMNYQHSQYSKQYGPISSQSMSMGHQSPQSSNQHGYISPRSTETNNQGPQYLKKSGNFLTQSTSIGYQSSQTSNEYVHISPQMEVNHQIPQHSNTQTKAQSFGGTNHPKSELRSGNSGMLTPNSSTLPAPNQSPPNTPENLGTVQESTTHATIARSNHTVDPQFFRHELDHINSTEENIRYREAWYANFVFAMREQMRMDVEMERPRTLPTMSSQVQLPTLPIDYSTTLSLPLSDPAQQYSSGHSLQSSESMTNAADMPMEQPQPQQHPSLFHQDFTTAVYNVPALSNSEPLSSTAEQGVSGERVTTPDMHQQGCSDVDGFTNEWNEWIEFPDD